MLRKLTEGGLWQHKVRKKIATLEIHEELTFAGRRTSGPNQPEHGSRRVEAKETNKAKNNRIS
jgi:hypothetical protein